MIESMLHTYTTYIHTMYVHNIHIHNIHTHHQTISPYLVQHILHQLLSAPPPFTPPPFPSQSPGPPFKHQPRHQVLPLCGRLLLQWAAAYALPRRHPPPCVLSPTRPAPTLYTPHCARGGGVREGPGRGTLWQGPFFYTQSIKAGGEGFDCCSLCRKEGCEVRYTGVHVTTTWLAAE